MSQPSLVPRFVQCASTSRCRIGAVALALLLVPALLPPARGEVTGGEVPEGFPGDLLNQLDHSFQARFGQINLTRFSLEPISTIPRHGEYRRLLADGDEEVRAVEGLRAGGWDGAFRMGSVRNARVHVVRAARAGQPKAASDTIPQHRLYPVFAAPIHLTNPPSTRPQPTDADLLPGARDALEAFRLRGVHRFRIGEWWFEARAIPMNRKECLDCHKRDVDGSLQKIGDPVGIALYGFARIRGTESRKPAP